jgi:hypothetical protein
MQRIVQMYDELAKFYAQIAPAMRGHAMGARILMSRPLVRPRVMFIAYQPGQSKGFESDCRCDLTWPDKNEYATCSWPLAKRVQGIVDANLLEAHTVVTNVNFFRAPSKKCWACVPQTPRRQAEQFSLQRVSVLIQELQPQAIVAIGFDVFDALRPTKKEVKHSRKTSNDRTDRVVATGEVEGCPVVGTLHLSGAQMSKGDRDVIANAVQQLFVDT